MMKRFLLIALHGKQAGNPVVRSAVAAQRAAGHRVEVRVTWEAGDVARIVREAVGLGVETVVAGGGDGTINEVTQALLSSGAGARPDLGILPLGTANDFAHSAGIPLDPAGALALVVDAPAVPIDAGRVGERTFLNVATGGFGTMVTVETPEPMKRVLGGAAYLVTGLRRFSSIESVAGRLEGPGFNWEGKFLVLAIGNGRQAGGGHVLCPDAKLNDGLLDVGVLPFVEPNELPARLSRLLQHGFAATEQAVVRARVPWLAIRSELPLHLNLDGEPIIGTEFRIEAVPAAIRVHLPPSDLLV
jgi:lipid kinase YegS